jgi:hypothetical protein
MVRESLLGNRVLFCKAFEMLELCEGRLSRTVLRGRGASNGPLLPDREFASKSERVWCVSVHVGFQCGPVPGWAAHESPAG